MESINEHAPRVAVGLLIRRRMDEQVFLTKRLRAPEPETWTPPWGYLSPGEEPKLAARGQATQAGLEVTGVRFVGVTSDVFSDGPHCVTIWFQTRYITGDARAVEGESSEVGWFAPRPLPKPRFLPFQHVIDHQHYRLPLPDESSSTHVIELRENEEAFHDTFRQLNAKRRRFVRKMSAEIAEDGRSSRLLQILELERKELWRAWKRGFSVERRSSGRGKWLGGGMFDIDF